MNPATPYFYSYLVGGLIFCFGLFIGWRQGYLNFTARGIRNLSVCLFVLLFFAGVQGYLQFAPMSEAESVEYGPEDTESNRKIQPRCAEPYSIMRSWSDTSWRFWPLAPGLAVDKKQPRISFLAVNDSPGGLSPSV